MINFAIVGCGRIAPRHAHSITNRSDAKLIAVCDIKKDKAEQFARENASKAFFSYTDLLQQENIDVVNICTPSGLHAEMAIQAMEKGKDVIVEKPMALKVSDALKMIEASKKYKRKLCVVLQNRYNPPMQEMKRIVERNILGKIYHAAICVRWFRPQEYYNDGWHGTEKMDGGVLMNQSIHHIDALQWLLSMPEEVFCYKDTVGHKMEMEDVGFGILKFPNHIIASVEASVLCWPQNLEGSVAIFAENGSVKVGGTALNRRVIWKIKGQENKEKAILAKELEDPLSVYGQSHEKVIENMIWSIKHNTECATSGIEGIKSLKIVESFYKSAKTGKIVKI